MLIHLIFISIAQLTLVCAVQFLAKPEDVRILEGHQATLTCFLSNFEEGSDVVSWWKGSVKISSNNEQLKQDVLVSVAFTTIPYSETIMYSLGMSSVSKSDDGLYHCEISDVMRTRSLNAKLTVLQKPSQQYPLCKISKESYTVNSEITLSCITEDIYPKVKLEWLRDDVAVIETYMSEDVIGELVHKQYRFTAKKSDNKARFMCKQKSDVLDKPSNCTIGHLNIYYRPEIKIQHTRVMFAGSDAILFCQSFSNPQAVNYIWTFQPQLTEDEYTIDGQVLRLIKPSISRNGTAITCTVENSVGTGSDMIHLNIVNPKKRKAVSSKYDEIDIESDTDRLNHDKFEEQNNHRKENSSYEESQGVSLYVVIVIIVLIVIIVVVVVIIPVYYQCFCRTRTAVATSGREIYQPTVYYDTRDNVFNSELHDRSLPRLPSTGHYGHWRHSFASQVPEDLDQEGYNMPIGSQNVQNTM